MSGFQEFYKQQIYEELIDMPRDILNKYNFLECIADTDNSTTYVVVHKMLKTKYVLKIYKNTYQANEYKILSKVNHSGIPRIIDVIAEEERTIVIEEFFDGKTLDRILNEAKDFLENRLIDIFLKICDILSFIHSQKPPIIHKDIKPENIIINSSGDVKLIDFGSARYVKENQFSDTMLLGTRGYAAPEQYGFKQTDQRTDIYSLGIMIDEIIIRYEIKPSPKFEKIISKCKQIDPDNRFNSVDEIVNEINEVSKPIYKRKFALISFALVILMALSFSMYNHFFASRIYRFKSDVVAEAVSIYLDKSIDEITIDDLKGITEISIWGENITLPGDKIVWESAPGRYVSAIIINDVRYTERGRIDTLEDFKHMENLYTLILMKQNITELSPIKDLDIVHLYLNDNNIEEISPLENMRSLYTLEVGGNPISDFSILSSFDNLGELDISNTKCTDVSFLRDKTSIKLLSAKNLKLENIDFLMDMYKLESLNLEYNKITDISVLKGLNKLEYLNVANNSIADISVINNMQSMKYIVIRDTNINENMIDRKIKILQD